MEEEPEIAFANKLYHLLHEILLLIFRTETEKEEHIKMSIEGRMVNLINYVIE